MSALYESYMIEAMIENYLLVFLFTAIAAIVTNKLLVKSLILPLPEIQYPINSDPDFEIREGVLIKYKGTAAVVVIPEGVTRIGDRAFWFRTGLTSITIGNSVTSIGLGAFTGCEGLTSVGCEGLTSVTIGNSVTSIGEQAFGCCTGLTSITVGNSVTSIGAYAFGGCSGLTSVTMPDSVTSIGLGAFYHCTGLTSMTIPDNVISIGYRAFEDCSGLTSVTIPDSVTSIGERVFGYCTGLTSVTIGNSVTSIGEWAFEGCTNLRHISVPAHLTDQQILDLRLPLECIIERRELAILPVVKWDLAQYLNQNFNLADAAIIKRFRMFVFYSRYLVSQGKLPFLPGDVWGVVLDQLRTVYLPSSKITIRRLLANPDSQERKDKVADYEQEVRPLLTHSPEQGG